MILKRILFFSLLLSSFLFSSCVDLIEEIDINKNLSGHYEIRLETGGLGMFGKLMNTAQYAKAPAIKDLDRVLNKLQKQEGIHNVHKILKPQDLQFYVSFDFDNEDALNEAIYALADMNPHFLLKKFLKIKKQKIVRPNLNPYIQKIIKDKDLLAQLPSPDLLTYVNFVTIINAPKEIKSVSGKKAILQNDKQSSISNINLYALIMDKKSMRMKVKM
ncbi:MAG: hypothetical protein B7C24_05055 [Bacteroidetes bacterium 4572_77]|nr:MAG: hypothetical protein B7C24_05055 [Bacteroidetes bacterium 4572_77]